MADSPADAPGPPLADGPIVLASRSPRRRALLEMVVPAERLRTLAPADPAEESLDGFTTWREIEAGLLRIADAKRDAALARIAAGDPPDEDSEEELAGRWSAVIAADTAVVAGAEGGELRDGELTTLGQPPADDWERTVRGWFRKHYIGRTHVTATAVSVAVHAPAGPPPPGRPPSREAGPVRTAHMVIRTRVTVRADAERHLERLFAAAEPPGRAGGVAIGGLFGALLVERVDGSLSNVSGLPLRETIELLAGLGVEL
ncbi:Maf family protein [Alienimonas sp. DA493]|uniref:Maf family protein n=1 Tax=Alienimonas sp. DA493 TaxID=3373605 RepID=UPI0037551709